MLRRSLPITIAVLIFLAAPPVQAYETHVEAVFNSPAVTYKKAFDVDATLDIWNRALDHPFLMGKIWGAYEFQPPYTVIRTDAGIHVSDPSGINGDLRQIDQSDRARAFYATGAFDHWAVPSFFTASGVIVFACNTDRGGLAGEATIFMRGDNGISRLVMRIFSGILTRRIGNRTDSTLENLETIIRDIANEPWKVRDALNGQALSDFDRVFPETKIKRAEGRTPSDQ